MNQQPEEPHNQQAGYYHHPHPAEENQGVSGVAAAALGEHNNPLAAHIPSPASINTASLSNNAGGAPTSSFGAIPMATNLLVPSMAGEAQLISSGDGSAMNLSHSDSGSLPVTPVKHTTSLSVGLKQEKAHVFFQHYLNVRPDLADSPLSKSTVYTIYRRMMPDDYRYDFANFSNALYDWAYSELIKQHGAAEAIDDAIRRFEVSKATKVRKTKEKVEGAESITEETPPRKRQRKRKTPEDETKDRVKNLMRNTHVIPFVALKPIEELDHDDKFVQMQPDHIYSIEQLHEWELSPGQEDFKQNKNVKVALTYSIKEDDSQYLVFVNVPYFPQNSLAAWATNTQIVLEGTISLPSVVEMHGKQVDITQLAHVEAQPRQNELHLGKFKQVIELPKPINPPCSVFQISGLVIVGVDKQAFTVSKTIL